MTRRRWWVLVGLLVVFAGAAVTWLMLGRGHPGNDCASAREIIAVNKQHSATVDAQANAGEAPTQNEYQQWADKLSSLAGDIDDPALAAHAHKVADTAHQSVALNPALLAEQANPGTLPGPAVEKYATLSAQFSDELSALDQACPV